MPSTPTTNSAPDALTAVAALGRALDAVRRALASGSASDLLVTETALASALTDVSRIASLESCDRARLRAELAHAREMLNRCRTIGTALAGAIDGCLQMHGLSTTYDRVGAVNGLALPARGMRCHV